MTEVSVKLLTSPQFQTGEIVRSSREVVMVTSASENDDLDKTEFAGVVITTTNPNSPYITGEYDIFNKEEFQHYVGELTIKSY